MRAMLPRLFFEHFRDTSFVAEEDGEIVGFLCGFLSQTYPDQATSTSSASVPIIGAAAWDAISTSGSSPRPARPAAASSAA